MNTNYYLNVVAGNVLNTKTSPSLPTRFYLGLSSTEPTLAGGNVTEPAAGTGYARVQLTSLSEPTDGVVTNSANIDFAESTAAWGTMSHYAIFDAATGGNLLMYGRLSVSRTVEAATIMTIKAGSLNISVVNPTA